MAPFHSWLLSKANAVTTVGVIPLLKAKFSLCITLSITRFFFWKQISESFGVARKVYKHTQNQNTFRLSCVQVCVCVCCLKQSAGIFLHHMVPVLHLDPSVFLSGLLSLPSYSPLSFIHIDCI